MAEIFDNAGLEAALIAGASAEMDEAARQVQAAIKAEAMKDAVSGDFVDSIKVASDTHVESGVKDRVVYSDDEAAYPIERGFRTRSGTNVPGKFYFRNIAQRGI